MKKILNLFVLLIACSMVFSSCSKDSEEIEEVPSTTKTIKINGHEGVDLGLPSGVKWATCNLDASKPYEYGEYYAWGEIEPTTDKYIWGVKEDLGISEISGTEYDAATHKWGGSWRMPTIDEMEELVDKCIWQWAEQKGKYGYKVTGPNGNFIFLPAAGYRYVGNSVETSFMWGVGSVGGYLISTSYKEIHSSFRHIEYLYFFNLNYRIEGAGMGDGYSIRPVSE